MIIPPTVTIAEAARQLKCSIPTVKRMVKAGNLTKVKLTARRVGITQASLDEHFRGQNPFYDCTTSAEIAAVIKRRSPSRPSE
jgi:excisionase family DNA binding protein